MTVPLLWDEAVGRLRSRVTEKNYDMWLRPIELLSFDGVVLRLRAPNSYARFWFESNFLGALLKEIRDLGHDVRVEFDADGPDERPPQPPPQQATGTVPPPLPQPPPPAPPVDQDAIAAPEAASLNPRYTFDTFVAGPSNQLAFAASQAAASSYPPKYNPVFLCGGVGLGKTHLLHSIGHQQLANRPSARIVYLSSERFMNEFVQAIRTGRMHEFRRNYREGIDALLIDDVQFLAGKESTQDEFFTRSTRSPRTTSRSCPPPTASRTRSRTSPKWRNRVPKTPRNAGSPRRASSTAGATHAMSPSHVSTDRVVSRSCFSVRVRSKLLD